MSELIRKAGIVATMAAFTVYHKLYRKSHPVRPNTVLFLSDVRAEMGGNMAFVADWLPKEYTVESDFLPDRRMRRSLKRFIALVQKMTTAEFIVLEDYFRYTSYLNLQPGQKICQLWHGCGAYKKFGHSRAGGPEGVKIHKGYKKYAKAITSAKEIRKDYAEAFSISMDKVQATGVPRTDIFFDEAYIQKERAKIYEDYPYLKGKKVILFAPTYRGLRANDAAYDFEKIVPKKFYKELGDDYVFIFKWHPATYNNLKREDKDAYNLEEYNGFFRDLSGERDINDLLLVTDILITDYSSVIFDYSLVNKPIVYYAFDLDQYAGGRGLYYDFEEYVYGRVAGNQDQLIEAIKAADMCQEKRAHFHQMFMEACDGRATEKTCRWIFDDILPD